MRSVQVSNQSRHLRVRVPAVRRLFAQLDRFGRWQIPPGDLSIVFLDDTAMVRLHTDFLDDPTPTDVITFPGDTADDGTGARFAGEICVCIPQAIREAPRHAKTVPDEILLYLVHGWLHLAGHDDHHAAPRAAMRRAERETLAHLREVSFVPDWEIKAG